MAATVVVVPDAGLEGLHGQMPHLFLGCLLVAAFTYGVSDSDVVSVLETEWPEFAERVRPEVPSWQSTVFVNNLAIAGGAILVSPPCYHACCCYHLL